MASLSKRECWVAGGFAVAGLVLLACGSKMSPGSSFKLPARASEDIPPFFVPPGRPVLGPDQHVGGIVFTPHRYPAAVGSDLTAAIHRGFTTLSLPADGDMLWMSAPPGEGTL